MECLAPFLAVMILSADPKVQEGKETIYPIYQKSFAIPIRVDPAQRDNIDKLYLFASTDQGKTWEKVDTASPDQKSFLFTAPKDGAYWFILQVLYKDKKKDPANFKEASVMKILVDTRNKVDLVTAKKPNPEEEILSLHTKVATLEKRIRELETRPVRIILLPVPFDLCRFLLRKLPPVPAVPG